MQAAWDEYVRGYDGGWYDLVQTELYEET